MIHSPRGVEDLLPPQTLQYQWIEKEASFLFSLYGYEEIRIPTFERTELFLRSLGKETDAGKQMYTFKDKKGRSLSLRPEATASVARAYLQHKLYGHSGDWKVYYMAPMFRYERPQAARLREFHQIGVEAIGEISPQLDVEVIEMGSEFFKKIGLANFYIQLNSIGCKRCRPVYENRLREYLKLNLTDLCFNCRRRYQYNILRVLDCKKKECQLTIKRAPVIGNYLCEDCQNHFKKVRTGLKDAGIKFSVDPHLVRGIDYYTRTIFEIVSSLLGPQATICAGGRYDDLVEELEGPSIPAIGFAIGVDRLLAALKKEHKELHPQYSPAVHIATLDEEGLTAGYRLARILRSQKIKTRVNLSPKSLSSQLKMADKRGARWVMIVGEKEVKEGKFILRNMESGQQKKIGWDEVKHLDKRLSGDG
ncbi:MAG: histidine--tRNA ligase [bacterium]